MRLKSPNPGKWNFETSTALQERAECGISPSVSLYRALEAPVTVVPAVHDRGGLNYKVPCNMVMGRLLLEPMHSTASARDPQDVNKNVLCRALLPSAPDELQSNQGVVLLPQQYLCHYNYMAMKLPKNRLFATS